MDKNWLQLSRGEPRYYEGIDIFVEFVQQNMAEFTYPCPCRNCKLLTRGIALDEMRRHLIVNGMMPLYTTWFLHGEHAEQSNLQSHEGSSSHPSGEFHNMNWTMDMLHDSFHFPNSYGPSEHDMMNDVQDDSFGNNVAHEKYSTLLAEAKRPLYFGSRQTMLELILKGMQTKVECRWSDKSFTKYLEGIKDAIPPENNCPGSYRDVKKIMKNMGLDYQIIHACEYGCVLYYQQHSNRDCCPICHEPRYATSEGGSKVPNKVFRYFPITPRLQRLYMSPYIAEEMRWHAEKRGKDGDNDLIHPKDGEAWENFDKEFLEFAHEIRNVRIGLSTDGFNPFGVSGLSHSTWPIIVMPYNLPPWMCMKKEFNILAMLISGPKSPGKCLNVFMRPLIDELKMLWNTGVVTFDHFSGSSFNMKEAVISTISDFPGLGMLGGIKTKGYKACPLCLDGVDASFVGGRMAYQGHRRWLSKDHAWRKAFDKFNGQVELRARPSSLSGREILDEILMHDFPTLSLHPRFKARGNTEKLCWTHKTVMSETPVIPKDA
ncbi:unnamed protein product [Rhodiola kirilowii]